MSEKRRDDAWTEVARNDEVACGLPEEVPHPDGRAVPPSVMGAAPERIEGMSEYGRRAWTEAGHNDVVAWGRSREGAVMGAAPERIIGRA